MANMEAKQTKHTRINVTIVDRVIQRSVNGRDYLIVPAVAVVEKVLNGEFLPAEEIAKSAMFWNGRSVVIDHPEWGSAGSAENFINQEIGTIRNAEYDSEGRKLIVEMWIDLDIARQISSGEEVVNAFQNGQMLEVSTGYWAATVRDPGSFNGERYNNVQIELVPDHLAILPNAEGACNVRDGCGAPRRNQKEGSMDEQQKKENCGCDPADDEQQPANNTHVSNMVNDENFILRLASELARALNIGQKPQDKEENMSNLIDTLVENEGVTFSREELEAMPESALEKIAALVSNIDVEEEEDVPQDPAPQAPAVDASRLDRIEASLEQVLGYIGAQVGSEVEAVTNELVASGAYSADELEGLELPTLKLMRRAVQKHNVDYGVVPTGERTFSENEKVLEMPSIYNRNGKGA